MTVIKPQAPFERLKYSNNSPEVALRRSIILQAIIDASNTSSCKEAKKHEQEAKLWLFNNHEEFRQICCDAGLEPDFVVRVTKEILKLHKIKHSSSNRSYSQNQINNKLINLYTQKFVAQRLVG